MWAVRHRRACPPASRPQQLQACTFPSLDESCLLSHSARDSADTDGLERGGGCDAHSTLVLMECLPLLPLPRPAHGRPVGRRPHVPGRLPRPGLERRHPAGHVPGYICIRPDLGAVRLTQSQGDGRPLAVIWAPVQHGRLARGRARAVRRGRRQSERRRTHHDVIDRATSCPGTPQPTNGLGDVVPQSVQPPFPTAPVRCLVLPSAQLRCSAALFSPPAGRTPSCPTTPPAGPVRDELVARHGSGQAQARSARHGKTCHPRAG